jgi:hypothetical protein
MLEPQEEYMLAKRWREAGDRDAAHRLIISWRPCCGQRPCRSSRTKCKFCL